MHVNRQSIQKQWYWNLEACISIHVEIKMNKQFMVKYKYMPKKYMYEYKNAHPKKYQNE